MPTLFNIQITIKYKKNIPNKNHLQCVAIKIIFFAQIIKINT